ncbi:AarF/ABC1/UbiB kinase family protein [Bdellovibrio bacteriovorus]|uniref:AarF/ABC1/UbiB kinase family protein n=1 Tax=Bdellovibrio bacteriovorus TaxID=959 RepID=UPI003AA9C616
MLRQLRFLMLFILILGRFAWAVTPEKVGLHLSFEERLALTYALMAQGETAENKEQILARAKNYFSSVYQTEVETVKVRNFDEFLKLHKGEWPNTHSVAMDLEMIEARGAKAMRTYTSDSARVQKQIETYLEWQQQKLKDMVPQDQLEQKLPMEALAAQVMALAQNPEGQKLAEGWVLAESDALLTEKMKELDRVGEKIAESKLGQQQDATMKIFLQTMFSEYFRRLSPASKKLIVSSYLGSDLNMPEMKKFELMVQNSGPQLQKLLQVVARQADLGPDMVEVFRGLENSVRPVPWSQVEKLLNSENGNYKFTYFERKALGVGTMAQVHRAKVVIDGQRRDVVVRFIKPGIADRVEEDKRILMDVAEILDSNPEFRKTGAPKLTPVVQDITDTVLAELSQEDTVARQKLAATRYEKMAFMNTPDYKNEIQFHVPKIYDGKKGSKFMVQELVIGKKLDKEVAMYKEIAPDMKRVIIEQMARVWAQEVMFGGGFYHSDLHQGNFMIQVTEPKIIVNILDYGMGGVISRDMQTQVMLLGAGTELLNSETMARAFWNIADRQKSTITHSRLQFMIEAKMHNIRHGYEQPLTMEMWTAWVMDLGLRLPYEFVSLNRGIVIVNKLLADAGSTMSISSLMKSMAVKNPARVYKALAIEGKISHKELVKLGWIEMKDMLGLSPKVIPVKAATPAAVIRCEMVFN